MAPNLKSSPLVATKPLLSDNATSANAVANSTTTGTAHPLVIKGYNFFDSVTGEYVVIKGIDYYPRPNNGTYNRNSVDFFTEGFRHVWERDVKSFARLGVNAVRLYAVDPDEDHDAFMCALRSKGIYAVIGLAASCDGCEISMKEAPACYPPALKRRGERIVSEFAKYPNTLAFSAGNEVNHAAPLNMPEWNAPCQKKFIRDMRAYIDSCPNMRNVPVGLVMADTDREDNAMYYNCRSDADDELENAEWLGLNSYVTCDGRARNLSEALGFQSLLSSFRSYNYSIPVLMTEFGCLSKTFPDSGVYEHQRNFLEAEWLATSPTVQEVFAGGFAFEYSIEMENARFESPYPFTEFGHQSYGIGYFSPEDCDDVDVMCEYNARPEFYHLRDAFAGAVNTTSSDRTQKLLMDDFEPEAGRTGRRACPKRFAPLDSFAWDADDAPDLRCPAPSASASFVCPAASSRPVSPTTVEWSMKFYFGAAVAAIGTFIAFASLAMWMGRRSSRGGVAAVTGEGGGWESGFAKRGSGHMTDSSSTSDEEEGASLVQCNGSPANYASLKEPL